MSIRDSLDIIDYNNKDHIKSLLFNYTKLEQLSKKGNTTATDTRLDLAYCLSKIPSPTNDLLKMYFIHGFTYDELTDMFSIGRATVNRHLDKGIEEIVRLLNSPREFK